MRKLLFVVAVVAATVAAAGPAVTTATIDEKGAVHIVMADGREHILKPLEWQNGGGFADAEVAGDGRTVGWVANQMLEPLQAGTNYAFETGAEVDVWRDGQVIRKFSPGLIREWMFLKNGHEVAIHTAPLRGQEFYDCLRFDVRTGKELEHWSLDRRDYVVPDWAKPLLVNDALPGPDEISNWIPEAQVPKAHKKE
jgi:hypothetical protein